MLVVLGVVWLVVLALVVVVVPVVISRWMVLDHTEQ